MSTTPRTDAAKEKYLTGKMGFYDVLNEARELETELAAAKLDAEDQAKWALRYLARAEKAEADTARIDWLEENMDYIGGGSGGTYTFFTPADVECGMLRDAIDAARKEASK